MRYVKRYVDHLGTGRLYFRKAGHPRNGEALKSPWPEEEAGSPLEAEVRAILATAPAKVRANNLAGATRAYELGHFGHLADSTKYEYRLMLKEFDADLGSLQITAFTPALILGLRNAWAQRGHRAANNRLFLLREVLKDPLVAGNLPDPFARIDPVKRALHKPEPHPIWPEEVTQTVIAAAIEVKKFGLARAVAIGRYTGARRGDLVKLPQAARQDGRIRWTSGKRRVRVDMREDPRLTEWLNRTPAAQPTSKWQAHSQRRTGVIQLPPSRLVFNISNKPYTEDGLGQELAKLVTRLFAEGQIDSARYDLHGLRHTRGVELAEAGLTDAQGAALMGHSSPSSFAQYRRQANVLKLSNEGDAQLAASTGAARTGAERPGLRTV